MKNISKAKKTSHTLRSQLIKHFPQTTQNTKNYFLLIYRSLCKSANKKQADDIDDNLFFVLCVYTYCTINVKVFNKNFYSINKSNIMENIYIFLL